MGLNIGGEVFLRSKVEGYYSVCEGVRVFMEDGNDFEEGLVKGVINLFEWNFVGIIDYDNRCVMYELVIEGYLIRVGRGVIGIDELNLFYFNLG